MKEILKKIPNWLKSVYLLWVTVHLYLLAFPPMGKSQREGSRIVGDIVITYYYDLTDFLFYITAPVLIALAFYNFKKSKNKPDNIDIIS